MSATRAVKLTLLLAVASVVACSNAAQNPAASGMGGTGVIRCSSDKTCGPDGACLGGNCITRTPIAPGWAIEIRPPSNSKAPVTERTDLTGATGVLPLQTDPSVDVRITFNASSASAMPSIAQVVLKVPSLIGGRPDLTFETGADSTRVTLVASEGVLARRGTVDLLPLPPADQQSPPFSFAIDTLAQDNNFTIPTNNVWLSGFLHDAVDQVPARPFVARAFQQGRLVSNVSIIAPGDGSFRLAIPAAAAVNPITVQVWPQDAAPKDPWFASAEGFVTSLDAAVITLPAYQTPQAFLAVVRGEQGESIDGAFVRAGTSIDGGFVRAGTTMTPLDNGTTRFSQAGLTGPETNNGPGTLALPLIPGTATIKRDYDVAVVPPPGTPFAARCADLHVNAGGADSSPLALPAIVLERRPMVRGNVTTASGTPVPNVLVTASRDPETAGLCSTSNAAATAPTIISTTTNASGAFALALDAGTYQLDYDPPADSWMPRFTDYNVAVNMGQDMLRPLTRLPPPALLEGQVSDADGKALRNAMIRIFEPRCEAGPDCKIVPILRATTQTDDEGHFRVAVAMPETAAN